VRLAVDEVCSALFRRHSVCTGTLSVKETLVGRSFPPTAICAKPGVRWKSSVGGNRCDMLSIASHPSGNSRTARIWPVWHGVTIITSDGDGLGYTRISFSSASLDRSWWNGPRFSSKRHEGTQLPVSP